MARVWFRNRVGCWSRRCPRSIQLNPASSDDPTSRAHTSLTQCSGRANWRRKTYDCRQTSHLVTWPVAVTMHPPRRSSSPTSAERMAEAYAQLELNRAHTSYLDTLQNALLTAVRMQHDQAHQQPPAQSAAPPTVQQQPISLATLPMAMAPAMPVSADAAMPAAPSTDEDASTHLLEVCTRKLSALQAQAKVTGWTEELKRRKAVLLPLMTQLLESEDALPAPSPAPTRSIEQATPAAYVQGPLLLTGTPPSALSDLIPGRPLPTTTAGMAGPSTAAASPPRCACTIHHSNHHCVHICCWTITACSLHSHSQPALPCPSGASTTNGNQGIGRPGRPAARHPDAHRSCPPIRRADARCLAVCRLECPAGLWKHFCSTAHLHRHHQAARKWAVE